VKQPVTKKFMEMAFTDAVRDLQSQNGSAEHYTNATVGTPPADAFEADEIDYIQRCDSFYMSSINANGWPYIQHRGGPAGFLKVTSPTTLAMPEFPGNKQFLTMGNLAQNDRVSLFLMDYPRKARLKIFARAKLVHLEEDAETASMIKHPMIGFTPTHALKFELEAFDWNCPKYITPRYTEEDLRAVTAKMTTRISELEAELAELKT
jgi:predicted pyridoxine 5'-phosphate oxidase superfamily flavin-nucleotide-binding protein